MIDVKTYDAKDWTIKISDFYVTGFGESMVSIAKQEPFSEATTGCQGDVVDNVKNNNLYDFTLSVLPTSPQFKQLIELSKRSEVFPVWAINKKLGITFGGSYARLAEMPQIEAGSTISEIELKFTVYDGSIQVD